MTVALSGYEIGPAIYTGTRTLVYRGQRQPDSQPVVIKFLRNAYPTFSELLQFRNQYTIAKNLNIPGIIPPLSLESCGNSYALVMEDGGGISLREYAKIHCLELIEILAIAVQLADILHDLHQNRVIHKDIKPANILIHSDTKQVKLIDFSIASLLPKETQEIKNPNVLEGTLAYLAPEQTGRMNRGIDYRSDFYALGVTLFELLAGKLPFESDDPMELVHGHIAQKPPSLVQFNVPEALAGIVAKLIAKNAENRYQSALGLKHDLEICLHQLKETGKIETFEIAKRDICDRFLIPEKLYGREAEVQALLDAFDRVANPPQPPPAKGGQGGVEMMLVAGFSGIGKTALINEVHKPIVRQRGYFIKGKFDQFNRNIPLGAFVRSFRDLMGQLLSESDAQLANWKARILNAVGESGQVIVDVIPELDRIIGTQPPVPELSGSAAQNRFNLVFQKFIQVFTTKEHPLVIFLDDLQWADSASLNLLQLLMSEANAGYLLILGAYRDNEVFPAHPLMLAIEQIEKAGVTVSKITLAPLEETTVNQLVADTLSCSHQLAQPLTQLTYQKTQGNPFFTAQFLKALHEDGWIQFQPQLGYWQCDIAAVRQLALTDDVVEFMALQLQKLPIQTQEIFKLAACIGNQFDLSTLACVSEQPATEAATALWPALQEGLILPISETYKFFQSREAETAQHDISVPYKFLHDRVQQAAYSSISDTQKPLTHYKIGKLLLASMTEGEREEQIFSIVNQLNQSIELVTLANEQQELAQLNLLAGKKAKAATAYGVAVDYFSIARTLLTTDCWERQYELALALHQETADAAYLHGDFARSTQQIEVVLQQARTLPDRIKVYEVQIQSCIAQHQLLEAIQVALHVLQLLDIHFPEQPHRSHLQQALAEVRSHLNGSQIASLIDLPVMENPLHLAAMKILSHIVVATLIVAPALFPLIVCQQVNLSIVSGNSSLSASAYANYGLLSCAVLEDISTGYEFGNLALALLDRFCAKESQAKTLQFANAFVKHWKEYLGETLNPLLQGYAIGLETGDLEYAAWNLLVYSYFQFFLGRELTSLDREMSANRLAIAHIKQNAALTYHEQFHQSVFNLLGKSANPCRLAGDAYDEDRQLAIHRETNDRTAICILYLNKLMLCYLFGNYTQAVENSTIAEEYLNGLVGLPSIPIFYFYQSLASLAAFPMTEPAIQDSLLQKIQVNQEKMQKWAYHAPANCLHRFQLVEAEKNRVLDNKIEAIDLYDRAIAGAKANEYIQEEALANELAAKFYLEWGKEKVAAGYMQEAYYCYAKWGAKAKTADLEKRYPQLLQPILQNAATTFNTLETLASIASSHISIHSPTSSDRSSSSSLNNLLDFTSIIKASQALSGTIKIDELLCQMTQIILQNSGGEFCALIIPNNTGEWQVRAIATLENTELCEESLDNNPRMPVKLIQYVKNTKEVVVIDDLKTGLPVICDYLYQQKPQSILCLPILNSGSLRGILYLENRLSSGVFAPDRILILNFLCTQAAISLENARLYRQAQDWAQQLEQSQLQIIQSEKMASLGNLVAGVAHEINNPLGFLNGSVNNGKDGLQDLLEHLALYQQYYPDPVAEIQDSAEDIDLEYLSEDLPKLLDSMQGAIDRIESISTSLRVFSRADTEFKVRANLHEGIDSTLLILKYRLKANEFRPAIEAITDYGNIPCIECFPGQLNQVFMNIIANAIDALDESNRGRSFAEIQAHPNRITIRTSVEKEGVKIAIADNGTGISSEVKAKIFDHLFTTKAVGKGTGLGLAIARQIIVEKHGGAIEVDSQIGQGTTFAILLPIGVA